MCWLLAVVLPLLFWPEAVNTAPELRTSGITRIAVPAKEVGDWRKVAGLSVETADLQGTVKLQAPGVSLRVDEASASHIPWVSSNGWRFMRQPNARFYYDVPAKTATLAAAEAFCYGSQALIHTDVSGIQPLAKLLDFLNTVNSDGAEPIADIGYVDDGSAASGEVMNLMIRDNLLFEIVPRSSATYKLTAQLGSKGYPAASVKSADAIVHKIRADLTDSRRTVRLFGTSIVIAHLTGESNNPRLHLINYGAAAHVEVGGFRVRVLGRYSKSRIRSFDAPGEQLLDYEVLSDATEFTIPELKTYAVVDLAP